MTKQEAVAALLRDEGCPGHSQDDEPVFILVARDPGAASVVRMWAIVATLLGATYAKVEEARDLATRMDEWRWNHGGGKVPD